MARLLLENCQTEQTRPKTARSPSNDPQGSAIAKGAVSAGVSLAGQPLAATIGFGTKAHVVNALSMDLNGNGITVSNAVWEAT